MQSHRSCTSTLATSLESIQERLSQLQEGVKVASFSEEAKSEIRDALQTPEQEIDQIAIRRILDNLAFDDMRKRVGSIPKPHKNTFEWIFNNASQGLAHDSQPEHSLSPPDTQEDGSQNKTLSLQDVNDINHELRVGDFKVPESTRDSTVVEPLMHWLSKSSGIFHIAGKIGSGKSTLMKFLVDHDEVNKKLQEWAGKWGGPDIGTNTR